MKPSDPTQKKHRRARGSGSVYKIGKVFWIAYKGPDGKRHAESSESPLKGRAEKLLQKRVGARENNLPVVPKAEHLTFDEAAQAVINDFTINKKPSLPVLKRRIEKHLTPFFGGRRMAGIDAADIGAYVAHRQQQGIVGWKGKRWASASGRQQQRDQPRAEILKRIFSLAIDGERLARRPKIHLLTSRRHARAFLRMNRWPRCWRTCPRSCSRWSSSATSRAGELPRSAALGMAAASISRQGRCGSTSARRRTATRASSR